MKVYAIVVTYNARELIDHCFGNLLNSSVPVKIVAIDNASNDSTPDLIKQKYPEVEVIINEKNVGFGKANNMGIKRALDFNADFIFLLNQDAYVEPDTVDKLREAVLVNPDYGIISPVHLDGSGTALDKKFTNALTSCNSNFINDLFFKRPLKEIYDVNFVNAAAWFIKTSNLIKVGGFSPFFFMYGEDSNLITRFQYYNLKIGVFTKATIKHQRFNLYNKEKYTVRFLVIKFRIIINISLNNY